jgi:1-deoxy-D-xylulose-5-phosphate reductoisomerase
VIKRVVILGSTGSIGKSALDVIRRNPDRFEVVALGANSNVALLADQIREFRPHHVAVADREACEKLKLLELDTDLHPGASGMELIAQLGADVVLCGMVGAVGLTPVLRAIEAGNRVALANKEPLVMAGRIVMKLAAERGVEVLPVDSEHNAIFQCLHGHRIEDVHAIHLTASGGPFYGRARESLAGVPPDEAAKHPTWNMGRKISVDSATLMNKGLEVIEAMWLFGLPLEKIDVVIHPQSIVHSLVEFIDGSILAHLGLTDMKFPILFALAWPERLETPMGRLDLTRMRELTFAAPDFTEFPCLRLALDAARTGGTAPALLNAANETAVEAFCQQHITFLQIAEVVDDVLNEGQIVSDDCLENVLAADAEGRRLALRYIQNTGVYNA